VDIRVAFDACKLLSDVEKVCLGARGELIAGRRRVGKVERGGILSRSGRRHDEAWGITMIKLRTSKIEDDITAIKKSSRNVYKKYNVNRDSTHRPEAAFPSQCQQSRLQMH
jgi:hypothetical protein